MCENFTCITDSVLLYFQVSVMKVPRRPVLRTSPVPDDLRCRPFTYSFLTLSLRTRSSRWTPEVQRRWLAASRGRENHSAISWRTNSGRSKLRKIFICDWYIYPWGYWLYLDEKGVWKIVVFIKIVFAWLGKSKVVIYHLVFIFF